MKTQFHRHALIERILSRDEPLVVLDAPAGMGKSTLLKQIAERLGRKIHVSHVPPSPDGEALVLWDIPPYGAPAALPECFVAGERRIIIAKRSGTEVAGLARAFAYGRAYTLEAEALMVSEAEAVEAFGAERAEDILRQSGGWPLIAFQNGSTEGMKAFLREEFLQKTEELELVDLTLLLEGNALGGRQQNNLFPLAKVGADRRLRFQVEALRAPLTDALEATMKERLSTPAGVKAVAEAYAEHGQVVAAITTFQNAGFFDNAFQHFNKTGGLFFLYYHGPAAFDAVLSGFPQNYAHQSEILVLSLALQSLKRGDISRARRLLTDRFGDLANDFEAVFSSRSIFSREFREFRFLMLIYEDYQFTDEMLEALFAINAEFPGDAHLFRGSFYNSVLEFYIRRRQFAEAEEVAQRAMFHYESAGAPMLCFYISLHQAMMGLMKGDTIAARKHAALSAKSLADVPFETPNDFRLQALLDACIEYEGGRAEPLARFLNTEIDDFSHGEIWPSLMEFTLLYGSQAMATHFSLIAARGFLDRWRVYQLSNHAFQAMVSIREAIVLQNANRWTEAAGRLKTIDLRVGRKWLLANPEALADLKDRDDVAIALAWLRQILHEQPNLPQLEVALGAAMGNLNITDRQRLWPVDLARQRLQA
jgi:hypothetical protein